MSNEQQQHVSAERYQKLVAYVKELASNFNELAIKVEQLENWEKTRQRLENEQMERAHRHKVNTKLEGRNETLEAEVGS